MNPKPSTRTPLLRTLRHRRRHLKIRMQRPHTSLIHAEHREILRLDLRGVGFVGDGEGAAAEVVDAGCVELGEGLAGL